jgi:membrane protein implicated in regulation of membrane protease activity
VWDWLIVGGVLLVMEVLAPGVFMLWLGLAALLVGVVSLVVDWPWQAQFIAFAVFAIAAIPIWRQLAKQVGMPTDEPFLNRRAEAFVGRVFTLGKPIVDGSGTIGIDDTEMSTADIEASVGSHHLAGPPAFSRQVPVAVTPNAVRHPIMPVEESQPDRWGGRRARPPPNPAQSGCRFRTPSG